MLDGLSAVADTKISRAWLDATPAEKRNGAPEGAPLWIQPRSTGRLQAAGDGLGEAHGGAGAAQV
ncbi:hypothetical protein, partial [Herbaspirillum seropedicae]|uniref:hypothetical protein n=1 Tax=Herbaspirillum seropedicae TaxID=964 RepID=UPI0031DE11CE